MLTLFSRGQSCAGKWITIDDKTRVKKSIVELFWKKGKLYGKIIYLYPEEGREDNPNCTECKGELKNQPVVGLEIVQNLSWDGSQWEDGTIVDPEDGKKYTVKMWLNETDENVLTVRGYIGFFYRTQYWVRKLD